MNEIKILHLLRSRGLFLSRERNGNGEGHENQISTVGTILVKIDTNNPKKDGSPFGRTNLYKGGIFLSFKSNE